MMRRGEEEEKKMDPTDAPQSELNYENGSNGRHHKTASSMIAETTAATAAVYATVSSVTRGQDRRHDAGPRPSKKIHGSKAAPGESSCVGMIALGHLIRTVLLDVPLVLIATVFFGLQWIDYLHEEYLHLQLQAMVFNEERQVSDVTYYERNCDLNDISTSNPSDLFLSPNATAQEAYEHQLKHGFTAFKKVLKDETSINLRNFVDSRNYNLTPEESIFVIENKNRYSFGLGTEEPTVVQAMKEIANHYQLRPALELILGPNPALIEMTAITIAYGAIDQYWHDDVIPTGSAIRYARSFGPSYSIFIQLQDTTREMGMTGVCPGSHYCSGPMMESLCEEEGYQVVDNETGIYEMGDALLMNMNSWHRGSAHTDPNGRDRVMLILTFVPKPRDRCESRQMSQGITFSLRWDMWGHTLEDLAAADTRMTQPWATLRALGMYKPSYADWGVDYITGGSMRMANEDNGFRKDELEVFMDRGGFWWLPMYLHGEYDEENEGWYEFYQDTLFKCIDFLEPIGMYSVLGYAFVFSVLAFAIKPTPKSSRFGRFARVMLRLISLLGIPYVFWRYAQHYADSTDWARDIKARLRYSTVFEHVEDFGVDMQGPGTIPTRHDVLIEHGYSSPYMNMYQDFIQKGHPGNKLFHEITSGTSAAAFAKYPEWLRQASAQFAYSVIQAQNGRVLKQGIASSWHWMDEDLALEHVRRELAIQSHPLRASLHEQIQWRISEFMYGEHRNTLMSRRFAVPQLRRLETKILNDAGEQPELRLTTADLDPEDAEAPTRAATAHFHPEDRLQEYLDYTIRKPFVKRTGIPPKYTPQEPAHGNWLKVGDMVEVVDGKGVEKFWYPGTVTWIDALGLFTVRYYDVEEGDEDEENVVKEESEKHTIRPFEPYYEGDEAQVMPELGQDFYVPCTIIKVYYDEENESGYAFGDPRTTSYDVFLPETRQTLYDVSPLRFRRPGKREDGRVPEYKKAYG